MTLSMMFWNDAWSSPFIVPLGAFAVAIVAIGGGIYSKVHADRLRAQQRMALLAQGMSPADVERMLAPAEEVAASQPYSRQRALRNTRRAATVLISCGLGIVAFFAVLALILGEHDVWAGAATGLIPLAIGVGFIVDYRMQIREGERELDSLRS